MTEPMDDLQWAAKLDKIASAISQTIYDNFTAINKYNADRHIVNDDADYLHILAKDLRIREYARLLEEAKAAR